MRTSIRTLFLAAAFSCAPAGALSLGLGIKGGLNLANADVDEVDDTEMRQGLALGAMLELGVTRPFSLQVEPMYVQRGARFDILGSRARGDFDYLEIPVLFKAKFGRIPAHAYLFAGPSLGIKLNAEGNAWVGTLDLNDEAAAMTFSGEIGAGGAFALSQFVYLSADVRYSHQFTDALDRPVASIDSWMARDIRILGGILLHLMD